LGGFRFRTPRRPGGLARLALGPRRRDGGHDPVGGHTARLPADASAQAGQGAHVAVFEGPLACLPRRIRGVQRRQGPQGDLDRLFAVGGHGRAVGAVPA